MRRQNGHGQEYQIRAHLPTRKTFFDDLRALTRYLCSDSWVHLLSFMLEGLELHPPPNTQSSPFENINIL